MKNRFREGLLYLALVLPLACAKVGKENPVVLSEYTHRTEKDSLQEIIENEVSKLNCGGVVIDTSSNDQYKELQLRIKNSIDDYVLPDSISFNGNTIEELYNGAVKFSRFDRTQVDYSGNFFYNFLGGLGNSLERAGYSYSVNLISAEGSPYGIYFKAEKDGNVYNFALENSYDLAKKQAIKYFNSNVEEKIVYTK